MTVFAANPLLNNSSSCFLPGVGARDCHRLGATFVRLAANRVCHPADDGALSGHLPRARRDRPGAAALIAFAARQLQLTPSRTSPRTAPSHIPGRCLIWTVPGFRGIRARPVELKPGQCLASEITHGRKHKPLARGVWVCAASWLGAGSEDSSLLSDFVSVAESRSQFAAQDSQPLLDQWVCWFPPPKQPVRDNLGRYPVPNSSS